MRVRREYLRALLTFAAREEGMWGGLTCQSGMLAASNHFAVAFAPCEDVGSFEGKAILARDCALIARASADDWVEFVDEGEFARFLGTNRIVDFVEAIPFRLDQWFVSGPRTEATTEAAFDGRLIRLVADVTKSFDSRRLTIFPGESPYSSFGFKAGLRDQPPMTFSVMPVMKEATL